MNTKTITVLAAILILASVTCLLFLRSKGTQESDTSTNLTALTPEEWSLVSAKFYRDMGFFDEYASLSDNELAAELQQMTKAECGEGFNPADVFSDLLLLSWDKNRVWWDDTEADVYKGNNVYVETLEEWARISRGAFLPENITETWESEQGPVWVDFTLDGTHHRLQPQYNGDWLDISIIDDINRLIRKTDYRFEVYEAFDQTAFVVVLTQGEKLELEQKRGWRFQY